MRAVRLGIIGVGDVAQRDYLPEAHRLAGKAEISILCGRDRERVSRVASEYGVPSWSTSVEDVLASDVDAIVNLTPAPAHEAITLAALRSGKHVYSEKPLASDPEQARKLRDEAAERRLVLVCAPSVLLFPQLGLASDIVTSGRLGTVLSARAQALGGIPPWPGYDSDPTPFFAKAVGPLVDMAVYPLHALTGLLGPVECVAAMAAKSRDHFTVLTGPRSGQVVPVEADDQWQLILRIGPCVASLEANFSTVTSAAAECELRGDKGALAFSLLDVAAPVSVMYAEDSGWSEIKVPAERDAGPDHILGVLHLADCIIGNGSPLASAAHAIHVLDVIAAARTAASTGRTVNVKLEGDAHLPRPSASPGSQ